MEKHRRRLVREADAATRKAHERYGQAIDQLEQARAELTECRAASLGAAFFPNPLATSGPPVHALAAAYENPSRQPWVSRTRSARQRCSRCCAQTPTCLPTR